MRLAIHELQGARRAIIDHDLRPAFKMLARVARIFEQLNGAWDVLRTMTPSEYTAFRPALGNSSGFQSHQYRLIEFILGNRQTALMKVHGHTALAHAALTAELALPSLYQATLTRTAQGLGLQDPSGLPKSSNWTAHHALQDMWQKIYEDPRAH